MNAGCEHGAKDDEISIISLVQSKKIFKGIFDPGQQKQSGKEGQQPDKYYPWTDSKWLRDLEIDGAAKNRRWKFSIHLDLVSQKRDFKSFDWITISDPRQVRTGHDTE